MTTAIGWRRLAHGTVWAGLVLAGCASLSPVPNLLTLPATLPAVPREVGVEDVVRAREIDALQVSPDGHRYAVLVRQADPVSNTYRAAWFVGESDGGALQPLADAGQPGPRIMPTGHAPGFIEASQARWSPDGTWFAFTARHAGEVQLWSVATKGGAPAQQRTHHAADIRDFAWSADGQALYYTSGATRAELQETEHRLEREGYRYDEDLWQFTDLMGVQRIRAESAEAGVWRIGLAEGAERAATPDEQQAFQVLRMAGSLRVSGGVTAALVPDDAAGQRLRLGVQDAAERRSCGANTCAGLLYDRWWTSDGRILFWRGEGINDAAHGFYLWKPGAEEVSTLARLEDDHLRLCALAAGDRLLCVRESAARPDHLVAIELASGRIEPLAQLNPEFDHLRRSRVERIEWATPRFPWNVPDGALAGLYPDRAYGYVIYPPDFDPARRYPVFIDPYVARGFSPVGQEHALLAYAASGIVVLRLALPQPLGREAGMKQLYSEQLGYPHLSMLMESTLRGLETVAARGFVDLQRVGIGGVSHGSFVPLYLLQKHDRLAAISVSSPNWGPLQYYWSTRKPREVMAAYGLPPEDWVRRPEGEGRKFWSQIDIADHVDAIEAPILMQLASHETYALLRLIRHLDEARLPYDTYVFPRESHLKWQPAHRLAVQQRNLDWFRFWLQDYSDAAPAKSEQYARWQELRKLQCQNRRALRRSCESPAN